jgi:hypothetical protein
VVVTAERRTHVGEGALSVRLCITVASLLVGMSHQRRFVAARVFVLQVRCRVMAAKNMAATKKSISETPCERWTVTLHHNISGQVEDEHSWISGASPEAAALLNRRERAVEATSEATCRPAPGGRF